MTPLDPDACYALMRRRDPAGDGAFFVCVETTGIYCRPVCPARTPLRKNVGFVRTAGEAQALGFRACKRCRPETTPFVGAWNGTQSTVQRALALIDAGVLDGPDALPLEAFAERLGVGARHLRRLFVQHLGAAPKQIATQRRLAKAQALLAEPGRSVTDVALSAGYGSTRRFNAHYKAVHGVSPSTSRGAR
jgi:methylphosphotriester-DNA--protein-cysteine methyltransferase